MSDNDFGGARFIELPIIFSGDSVRAILQDRKTATRRTRGLQLVNHAPDSYETRSKVDGSVAVFWPPIAGGPTYIRCPYGQRGYHLWVRESWAVQSFSPSWAKGGQLQIAYRAGVGDLDHPNGMTHDLEWRTVPFTTWQKYACPKYHSWHSSISMPRWASRITLEIIKLRVERLQEISFADCEAEGSYMATDKDDEGGFVNLWDSLHPKKDRWADNPWVWMIEFDRIGG